MSFGFGGMEVTGLVESSFSGVVRGGARLEQLGSNGRRGAERNVRQQLSWSSCSLFG